MSLNMALLGLFGRYNDRIDHLEQTSPLKQNNYLLMTQKIAVYTRKSVVFVPFVLESMGGFGDACGTVLVKIGRALADIDQTNRNRAVKTQAVVTVSLDKEAGCCVGGTLRLIYGYFIK
jgi:hypothetical protein